MDNPSTGPVTPDTRKMSVITSENTFGFSGHFANSDKSHCVMLLGILFEQLF